MKITSSQLIEVSFKKLEKNPRTVLGSIYTKFHLKPSKRFIQKLDQYLKKTAKYKRNTYVLSSENKDKLGKEWKFYLHDFGYAANAKKN